MTDLNGLDKEVAVVDGQEFLARFLGLWKNLEGRNGRFAEIHIYMEKGEIMVQIWGDCTPDYCEITPMKATYANNSLSSISTRIPRDFTLHLIDDNLRLYTKQHDNDFETEDIFYKMPKPSATVTPSG